MFQICWVNLIKASSQIISYYYNFLYEIFMIVTFDCYSYYFASWKYIWINNKNGLLPRSCVSPSSFYSDWRTDFLPGKREDTQNKHIGRVNAKCKVITSIPCLKYNMTVRNRYDSIFVFWQFHSNVSNKGSLKEEQKISYGLLLKYICTLVWGKLLMRYIGSNFRKTFQKGILKLFNLIF